jgi:hypothetical protein
MFGYTIDDVPTKEEWFLKAYPDAEYRQGVRALWYEDTWANTPVGEANPRVFTVRCKDGTDKIISFVHVILEEGKQILS